MMQVSSARNHVLKTRPKKDIRVALLLQLRDEIEDKDIQIQVLTELLDELQSK